MKKWSIVVVVFCVSLMSCEEIIEVPDISGETVSTLAPSEAAVLNLTSVNFSWNAIEDAESYRLQVATPSFEAATQIVLDTILTETEFTQPLNAGQYQWRVRAENSGFVTAYTTQGFTVTETDAIDISNETVVLLTPANGLVFNESDTVNFAWETILNAETYTIQIATPDFDNAVELIENQNTTATDFSINNLDANTYEWRVRAENTGFQTDYTTQSFTVEE